MLPQETDVLIVGAGPSGLALAVTLQQAGIRPVIVDRLAAGGNTSRAAVVHAHTLEVLERIGVTDEFEARGLVLTRFALRDHDKALLELDFSMLPSRYAQILMIPQDETEAILAERLANLGGNVERGVSATTIEPDSSGATVHLETLDGPRTIRARYVVGGDGMHSVVRSAAGITFDGETYGESFVLADVHMDWGLSDEVTLFFSPEGMGVVAPLPDNRYRIVAPVEAAPEAPDAAFVQALLDARGPRRNPGRVRDVIWSSRFRVHHRVAPRYRSGPLFIMGDAAHVHSPAGGQGMNTGLVDAVVLGQLLADVLRGKAPEATLDLYEEKRRPAAAEVLELASRLTKVATVRSSLGRVVRNLTLRVLGSSPVFRRKLTLNLSGLARKGMGMVPPR
ncbi:FAD-dependent monooxygenase [Sinorhizobium sp. RAC02]|uniref:FAD-dependent monooxygenase n=1 Tax=Sinorhizobium sp. RAC02 TaxID=1842534 RepID=UPI00083DE5FE|nr:FAD-dependent monooxygenase [Sinorhizobium sp. RAC02]AOF89113.1 squalene epoxidase family protein [Sinorhizobium sp. RAC02]